MCAAQTSLHCDRSGLLGGLPGGDPPNPPLGRVGRRSR
jgi:hypothetical protein